MLILADEHFLFFAVNRLSIGPRYLRRHFLKDFIADISDGDGKVKDDGGIVFILCVDIGRHDKDVFFRPLDKFAAVARENRPAGPRDTLADGAELDIIPIPGRAWCMQCSQAVEIAARMAPCPVCDGYRLQVTGGDAMRVKELQVE